MTHHINGFIGDKAHLIRKSIELNGTPVIALKKNLAFMPLTDALYDAFSKAYDLGRAYDPINEIAQLLKPCIYVETDYFGGCGNQRAISFVNETKTYEDEEGLGIGNINAALRELDVQEEGNKDEFDVVGLGKYRTNDDWIESVFPAEPVVIREHTPKSYRVVERIASGSYFLIEKGYQVLAATEGAMVVKATQEIERGAFLYFDDAVKFVRAITKDKLLPMSSDLTETQFLIIKEDGI